jgi:F-box-like
MHSSFAKSRDGGLQQAMDDEINSFQESLRALKARRNVLSPISRLPPEILAAIFSFLPSSAWVTNAGNLARICVAHVCRRWRETALNYPRLWSDINLTKLTPVGMAEILARAKVAPLHLEVDVKRWRAGQFDTFVEQLEAHISHTCHLSISGHLHMSLNQVISSAPTLEFLSLSHEHRRYSARPHVNPVNLFNCVAPRLTRLALENCDVSWKSPLLKGLRTLKISGSSPVTRPGLEDWLDALTEMPQLEMLILHSATPFAQQAAPLISEPLRTATLPSLTGFHISASAGDCALALAHLVLPALTWLHVDVESGDEDAVLLAIPYVARHVYELQGTKPLRSILINDQRKRAKVVAWTMLDSDIKANAPNTMFRTSGPARLVFTAPCGNWDHEMANEIFDTLLTHLPVNSVSALITQNRTRLSREFWLSHASRMPLLEKVLLVPTTLTAFRHMLAEDVPPEGPRLPLLTKLTLVDVTFTPIKTLHLHNMVMKREQQGVPLEVLDLRTCVATDRAIQLLREVVVDVQVPLAAGTMPMEDPALFDRNGGIGYCCNEVEDDHDKRQSSYDESINDQEEDEDEDEEEHSELVENNYYGYDIDAISMF